MARKKVEFEKEPDAEVPADRYAALRLGLLDLVPILNIETLTVFQDYHGTVEVIHAKEGGGQVRFSIDVRMPGSIGNHTWESQIWMSGYPSPEILPVLDLIIKHVRVTAD
jgi:hypothetical protein